MAIITAPDQAHFLFRQLFARSTGPNRGMKNHFASFNPAGRALINRMMEAAVTDLPEPDSPTMPIVSPFLG